MCDLLELIDEAKQSGSDSVMPRVPSRQDKL